MRQFFLQGAKLAARLVAVAVVVMPVAQAQGDTSAPKPNYDVPIHGKGKFVDSPYGKIYYETEGQGPAVFLVAGGPGGSHVAFHPWFSALAKDHTVVYLDNIGRGRSDKLSASDTRRYTVARDAEDIEVLRQALGFEKVILIGHSYGGMPALAYAAKYPQKITKLVLSSTLLDEADWQANIDGFIHIARHQYPENWEKMMALRAKGIKSSDKAYSAIVDASGLDAYWYNEDNAVKWFRSGDPVDASNRAVYSAFLGKDPEWVVGGTLKGYNPQPMLKSFAVPTLICVGRYDRVATPRIAAKIKNALPAGVAQLQVFEKSGHRPWVEESDAYFSLVSKFLAQ